MSEQFVRKCNSTQMDIGRGNPELHIQDLCPGCGIKICFHENSPPGIVNRGDDFTISDISRAVYELDAIKFAKASFDQLPYEAVAIPFSAMSVIYMRLFVPWRHEKWPYSEAQGKWRERFGIKLSPPFYPKMRFIPLLLAAWALDKFRNFIKQKKSE